VQRRSLFHSITSKCEMTSYFPRTRAYARLSPPKRSTRRRARPLAFNSVKNFIVGLFSEVLARSMRLVSVREQESVKKGRIYSKKQIIST
jgi:hypothetical protein